MIVSLKFADRAAAVAALAAHGISATDKDGGAIIPTTSHIDGARVDIDVQGGGTGVVLEPTGGTRRDEALGIDMPEMAPCAGFFVNISWGGANPPDFGGAVVAPRGAVMPSAPPAAPSPVPASVTAFQAREALGRSPNPLGEGNMKDAVAAYVAAHEADNPTLRNAWDWVDPWERDSVFVLGLTEAFGMSPENIDDLFRLAATMKS
jgi:hypothetical protein